MVLGWLIFLLINHSAAVTIVKKYNTSTRTRTGTYITANGITFSNHIYIFVEDTIRVRTTRMRYEFQIEKRFIEHDLRH